MYKKIDAACEYIKSKFDGKIDIAIVLGSGLGPLANEIEDAIELDYVDIPYFPAPTLAGHAGKLIIGKIGDKTVVAMKGRFHYYEGHDMEIVQLGIRVFQRLGIEKVILTNACGGIRDDLVPGSIMIIRDHIGLFCPSVLRGENYDEFGPRFKDMTEVYNKAAGALARKVAAENDIEIKEGVYAYFPGPMYESPAEILAYRALGADAVGMSTVPEAIAARHGGQTTLGISLITNRAAGLGNAELDHAEVVDIANKAEKNLVTLVKGVITQW